MSERQAASRVDLEGRLEDARRAAEEIAELADPGVQDAVAMWERILADPLLERVLEETSAGKRTWWVEQGRIVVGDERPDPPAPTAKRAEAEHEEVDADDPVHLEPATRLAPPGGADPLPGMSVPVPVSRFIGRKEVLQRLQERVREERLITVTGSGGSGKTRLVHEFVRSFDPQDEVQVVDLDSVPDGPLVAPEVAAALGRQEGGMGSYTASVQQTGVPFEKRLAESLGDRHLLLVLDNAERVVTACADLVKVLLETCPNLRVICGSRQILDLDGEQIYRLPSLSLPPAGVALAEAELLESEAVELFLDRARAKQPDLRTTAEELETIAAICRGLDGIPYAIELVAARADVLSPRDILERLDHQLDWLQAGSPRVAARQRTMYAMVDWSHALLSSEEQTLLRRLAVFRGGFTLRACEEVCAFGELDRSSILPLLGALVGKSLVETKPVGDTRRYLLLETIRRFAQERSADVGEEAVTSARRLQWCLDLTERAGPHLHGPDQGRWLDELEGEMENLRAALQPRDDEGAGERLRLMAGLCRFLLVRGHLSEGTRHLANALEENPAPSEMRARVLSWSAEFALSRGRLDDASVTAQQALTLSREHHDRRAEARSLRVLGVEALRREPSEKARRLLLDSRHIAESISQPPETAFIDVYLGKLAEALGDQVEARRRYERAERTSREAERPWSLAWALLPLGDIDLHENAFARGEERMDEVLELGRHINSRQLIVLGHLYLGNSAYRRDDQDLAGSRFGHAMQAMERLDEGTMLALVRANMARVAVARGDLDGARRWLKLVDWRDPLLRLPARAQILRSRSQYLAAAGEAAEAERLHREALRIWLRLHDHRQLVEGLERLALLIMPRNLEQAGELLAISSGARERMGLPTPPVYLHAIEALAGTLEARQLTPEPPVPLPSVQDAVIAVLRAAPPA